MTTGTMLILVESATYDFTALAASVTAIAELAAAVPTAGYRSGALFVRLESGTLSTGQQINVKGTLTWPSGRSESLYVVVGTTAINAEILAPGSAPALASGATATGVPLGPALRVTLEPKQGATGGTDFKFRISVSLILFPF